MAPVANEHLSAQKNKENALLRQLDKGIDDMEQGRVLPLKESMERIKERLKEYEL